MKECLRWSPVSLPGGQLGKLEALEGGHGAEGQEDSREGGLGVLHAAAVEGEAAVRRWRRSRHERSLDAMPLPAQSVHGPACLAVCSAAQNVPRHLKDCPAPHWETGMHRHTHLAGTEGGAPE